MNLTSKSLRWRYIVWYYNVKDSMCWKKKISWLRNRQRYVWGERDKREAYRLAALGRDWLPISAAHSYMDLRAIRTTRLVNGAKAEAYRRASSPIEILQLKVTQW
jgi:hypothetical protein